MKFAMTLLTLIFSAQLMAANIEVDIKGMSCGMCVDSITKELKATEKSERVSVKLEDKKAYLTEAKGKKISDAEIKAAIKRAGYEATKIRRY